MLKRVFILDDYIKINNIKIYDMLSRLVINENIQANHIQTINVHALIPGIYSIEAIGVNDKVESGRFVRE